MGLSSISDFNDQVQDEPSPPGKPAESIPPPLPPFAPGQPAPTTLSTASKAPVPPVAATSVASAAVVISPPQESIGQAVELSEEQEELEPSFWQMMPSWLASTVIHLVLLLLLASYTTYKSPTLALEPLAVEAQTGDSAPALEELANETIDMAPATKLQDLVSPPADNAFSALEPSAAIASAGRLDLKLSDLVGAPGGEGDILEDIGDSIGSSLRGRTSAAHRARMVAKGGGTPGSERAVGLALNWLAEHQNSDGSWNWDHQRSPACRGRCNHPGQQENARAAATAMALMPFLGAGQTHRQGKYKTNVQKGLYYLEHSMRVEGELGSLWEPGGRMYGHGLAAIVFCEAYGMTRDPSLEKNAKHVINFIVEAQDQRGGGWRYVPGSPGDTSVVGWQLMALKSAHMAYLPVPLETIRKVDYFLDSVQTEEGALYGYTSPGNTPATTAIGLLCRMYLGWDHDRLALVRGVEALAESGPSLDKTGPPRNNMYYNYYATQVMHHYGGYEWTKWNGVMRDYLVKNQDMNGHQVGSWYFDGYDHGGNLAGGRLYCTALATMILEVYYRHLPLYTDLSTKDKFR